MPDVARRKPPSSAAGGKRPLSGKRFPPTALAAVVAAWALVVHLAFLLGSIQLTGPIGDLFWGDSIHFLEQSRAWAQGLAFNDGLPFHPPLVAWLLVPLWWLLPVAGVCVAGKLLMAAASAASYALFYLLLRRRLPNAFLIALLLPLSFGEIVLSSAVNSEAIYRLLLLALLALGWRYPVVAGALHGLAALTRAEHLPFALLLAAVVAVYPRLARWLGFPRSGLAAASEGETPAGREGAAAVGGADRRGGRWRWLVTPATPRRWVAVAVAALLLVLVPYSLFTAGRLASYNQRHAAELESPLPTLVPVSFYGPLNFALAQVEEEIFFARRSLPPAPAGPDVLDPTFPPHNEVVVHGYRIGLAAIAEQPGHFVRRSFAKLAYSLNALAYGWTWRDLPKPTTWVRQPVDLAYSDNGLYLAVSLALFGLGAFALRRQRQLLAIGAVLLLFRLAVNVVFFPYLRGMMIVAPFWLALELAGLAFLLRRAARPVLVGLLVVLSLVHFPTAFGERRYGLRGEHDAAGQLIPDRAVTLRYKGDR